MNNPNKTDTEWSLLNTIIKERDDLRNQLAILRTKNKELYDVITQSSRFSNGHLINPGVLDISTLPQLLGKDNPTILDIGCNDGFHTFRFFDLFPKATIHSFDPEPRAIKKFKQFSANYPKAKLHEVALGAEIGNATFYASGGRTEQMPEGWDMSGSIKKPTGHITEVPTVTFERSFKVEVETLDNWSNINKITLIDFIWADVQGAEADLIRGGMNAFTHKVKYFYTEYSNKELYEGQPTLEVIQMLLPNFNIHTLFENDVLLINKNFN